MSKFHFQFVSGDECYYVTEDGARWDPDKRLTFPNIPKALRYARKQRLHRDWKLARNVDRGNALQRRRENGSAGVPNRAVVRTGT